MVSQGSIGPMSGAPLPQPPPPPTPQAPSERTRRPNAIDIRDPDTGRDVMEDIYKSDPPSSEPANVAIRDEFYRRVHDAVNEAPERTPRTPVVSAISDSPEIVPKTGGPPKPHRPPEVAPPPQSVQSTVALSSDSPVSDASSPVASSPSPSSSSPSSSPSPAGVREEILPPPIPAGRPSPPRIESPPVPEVLEDSPSPRGAVEKTPDVEAEPESSETPTDKVVDNDADEKPLDLPLIENEFVPVVHSSLPAADRPDDALEVDPPSVEIKSEIEHILIDKLNSGEIINSVSYISSASSNYSDTVNVDDEKDNGAVTPAEIVTNESNELKIQIEETSVVTDHVNNKFSETSVPNILSENVDKDIDVNDNVSTKIDIFESVCEKLEACIIGDATNGEIDILESVNNVDSLIHEPIDIDNKLSNSIDKINLKNESNEVNDVDKKTIPRYPYKDGQWSPFNTSGKKCYDTDFLLALRQDPMSMKKPENIEKLDLIISDGTPKQKFNSNQGNMRNNENSNTFSNIRQDFLFPDFAKGITRGVMPSRKSQQGKSGSKSNNNPTSMPSKPQVINISLSLREDVKLNVSENAWKPKRLKTAAEVADESKETQELYKKFRSILNKLTPEKFDKLIKQILELDINTEERFKGVIDLVFEKAISEPSFALTYASLCHHLKQLNVPNAAETDTANFRYLIINKCQMEFEKASADETANLLKEKEIDECDDPDKKKEMKLLFEEEERRMRRRSVGNVRFIGELYKQGMISARIMIGCIENLIKKLEEETLECLCKLLTTIGKKVESEPGIDLQPYFSNMQKIVNTKDKRVSSRIRFMLQDVIDLRSHNWVPRQQAANPKTMEQIQMEVEMEQFNKSSYMNYPSQKDDRPGNMNKRGGSKSANSDEGWSLASSRNTRMKQQSYTVDAGKLKGIKRLSEISLQPTTNASWSRGSNISNTSKKNDALSSHKSSSGIPSGNRKNSTETSNMYLALDGISSDNSSVGSVTETSSSKGNTYRSKGASVERSTFNLLPSSETSKKVNKILSEIQSDDLENLYEIIRKQFTKSDLPLAIQELILWGFNYKKLKHMQAIGRASGKFVEDKTLSINEFVKIISECVSKLTDVFQKGSDIWDVVSKFIWAHRSIHNITLWHVHTSFIELIDKGMGYDLLLALFLDKFKESNENYIKDLWEEVKGMELIDWMTRTNVPQFLEKVPLEFLTYKEEKQMSQEAACSHMLSMMRDNVNRDSITDWIRKNIGESVKEAWFIRALTEAVYTFTVKPQESMQPRLDEAGFDRLKIYYPLLVNYVGNHAELELQCLFAIQRLIHKLEHPPGLTNNIFEHLWDCGQVVSTDGFLAWEANTDPHEIEGKGVMVVSLTSFFTAIKTVDEESDGATTSVMEDEY